MKNKSLHLVVLLVGLSLILTGCAPAKPSPPQPVQPMTIAQQLESFRNNQNDFNMRLADIETKTGGGTSEIVTSLTPKGIHLEYPKVKSNGGFLVYLYPMSPLNAGKPNDSYEVALKSVYQNPPVNKSFVAELNYNPKTSQWLVYNLYFMIYPIDLSLGKTDIDLTMNIQFSIFVELVKIVK